MLTLKQAQSAARALAMPPEANRDGMLGTAVRHVLRTLMLAVVCGGIGHASGTHFVHLTGHYSDADLIKGAAPKLLPMTFLYDANNSLVPVEQWPPDLADLKKHVGNGYCCVSENKPEKDNEPPADCVRAVFGTDMAANFKGLMDSAGKPIQMRDVPKHKWLLVVYAATWCGPCLKEANALAAFFKTSSNASDYVWLTLDVTRMLEAKAAARAINQL
jgi:hypothetical protein